MSKRCGSRCRIQRSPNDGENSRSRTSLKLTRYVVFKPTRFPSSGVLNRYRSQSQRTVITRTNHTLVSAIGPRPTKIPKGDAPARNETGKLGDHGIQHQQFKHESPETHQSRYSRFHIRCGSIRVCQFVRRRRSRDPEL